MPSEGLRLRKRRALAEARAGGQPLNAGATRPARRAQRLDYILAQQEPSRTRRLPHLRRTSLVADPPGPGLTRALGRVVDSAKEGNAMKIDRHTGGSG